MINFIDEQLTLWSDPLFSKDALEQRKSLGDKKEGFSPPHKDFSRTMVLVKFIADCVIQIMMLNIAIFSKTKQ